MVELALLLQSGSSAGASGEGIFHFFAGVVLILCIYSGAWGFTYWISKDE